MLIGTENFIFIFFKITIDFICGRINPGLNPGHIRVNILFLTTNFYVCQSSFSVQSQGRLMYKSLIYSYETMYNIEWATGFLVENDVLLKLLERK